MMPTLKRASKHRPGGPRDDDIFDVFDGDRHVGRTMRTQQTPAGEPWFWSITVRASQRPGDRDYAARPPGGDDELQGRLGAQAGRIGLPGQ